MNASMELPGVTAGSWGNLLPGLKVGCEFSEVSPIKDKVQDMVGVARVH